MNRVANQIHFFNCMFVPDKGWNSGYIHDELPTGEPEQTALCLFHSLSHTLQKALAAGYVTFCKNRQETADTSSHDEEREKEKGPLMVILYVAEGH